MNTLMPHAGSLYVDGQWLAYASEHQEPVVNPATEEVIGYSPIGTVEHAVQAVLAARRAFDSGVWSALSARDRAAKVQELLDYIAAREDAIVELIVAETGCPRAISGPAQFGVPMKHARHSVDLAPALDDVEGVKPELIARPDSSLLGTGVRLREPAGVAVCITPYNFPFLLNTGKVVQALLAGCTVVLKPSPYTPLLALMMAEMVDAVGFPAGVFNVVTGEAAVGEMLTSHPAVDLVSFTGSDKVGAAIQAQSAPTLKRCLLELGGKSAMIVRADADLDVACAAGLASFTTHSGQGCGLHTRHLVHNSIRDEYVARVADLARQLKVGDPTDLTTNVGPLIREVARSRTEEYVKVALEQGARLVVGGARPEGLERGYYHLPTLFDDVSNDMRIAREEVFGPIAVVIGYDTDDEAVAIANDSDFGLHGGVHSRDFGAAYQLARRIRTGTVAINGGAGTMLSDAPYGGLKRSGYGKEYGIEGLHEFSYQKLVTFKAG